MTYHSWNAFCVNDCVKSYFILLTGLFICACSGKQTSKQVTEKTMLQNKDTTIQIGGVDIRILTPAEGTKPAGTLLLLPGWNYSNTKWCDSTDVCSDALLKGFTVVAPNMGKSIYATEYFPETRADYRKFPTLTWLDSALDILKSRFGLFQTPYLQRNFVLGLSTGARGGALICAKKPGFFHAAALLSGDYDQTANTEDALCINVYGPYNQFPNRWKTVDNPIQQVGQISTPMYIGHGGMDAVVHVSQSIAFHDSIMAHQRNILIQNNSKFVVQKLKTVAAENRELSGHLNPPGLGFVLDPNDYLELNIMAAEGHNFHYWRKELPLVWDFFEKR